MIRLYTPQSLSNNSTVTCDQNQNHYLLHVMRRKVGDQVHLFNEQDGEWRATIETMTKKTVSLCIHERRHAPAPSPDITLCFALVKNTPLQNIITKATELGVRTLQPILTERTVARHFNAPRCQTQMTEAAEQSERCDVPQLGELLPLPALLKQWDGRPLLYCNEAGDGLPAGELLPQLNLPLALVIGPEGGFSTQEFTLLAAQPYAKAMTLGPRILRADTAALTALACAQMMCGDWINKPNFTE